LVLTWVLLCGLLAFLPAWWTADWSERAQERWFVEAKYEAVRLTQEWEHWTWQVPAFRTGSEEIIRQWLLRESLVTALVDPEEGRVWLRENDHFRLAKGTEEGRIPAEWARKAMEVSPAWSRIDNSSGIPRAHRIDANKDSDAASWWLVGNMNPDAAKECAIVTFFGKWCLIKRWVPGSPEVEQWLQGTSRPQDTYRFGVLSGFQHREALGPPRSLASFTPGSTEVAPMRREVTRLEDAPFRVDLPMSGSFGAYWLVVLQMTPEAFRGFRSAYHFRLLAAWLSYGLLTVASGFGLSLYLYSRNRERLQADRLASLAHSLKTPLAILKLRCDTALNNELPREVQETQLLEIRSETDQLVRTIESGLEAMRSSYSTPMQDRVDGTFFEQLDEKYTPAFEAQGRLLEVYGSDVTLRCCASALDSALATLIENALLHGKGCVEVKATLKPELVRITVRDEGEGIRQGFFQELRTTQDMVAAPGAGPNHGQGMGLLVLIQLTRREGWGLSFSAEEPGFSAILEIPNQT